MKKVDIIEFKLKESPSNQRLTKQEWLKNPEMTDEDMLYSFNFRVPEKDVDVFNRWHGNGKKLLQLYNGEVVSVSSEMVSYHIGDGWVEFEGITIKDEKEFEKLKANFQVFKY